MRRVASRAIARERYQIDHSNLQEMANRMSNKKLIRLTESDLHRIVKESVDRILKEGEFEKWAAQQDKKRRMQPNIDQSKYPSSANPTVNETLEEYTRNLGDSKPFAKGMKESCNEESFQNNQNYTHFAVSKRSGKILNGWDYSEYDPSELRQFKKDYFDIDMQDYGFDPKSYKIVTGKYLLRQGLDPDDNSNWANNDEANSDWIG